ncbi:inner nuclear membrane protein enriched at telomere/subtelomere region [Puccinia graminis f. sp. tritici]|uniref:Inner nuclear membrane protein enriched at telomere/subtelomere region n=1 Tax=Puccinia graminis f. sp. tritici TaxID=56615 RepID=A0A5B0MK25_PUCGR|nr:inner nuclear membrane protein enriched at telomere/subtelomere region [Puccinia graminis f. sp. tritici]
MALSMDLYDRIVSRSTNPEPPPDWMHPEYDPNIKLTIPKLRGILLEHKIAYNSSTKKPGLVELFHKKLKPMIPRLLKDHCTVEASPAGIFDMALGRYLTAEDTITPSRSPDPGPKAVPAYHPSLEGKTIAQIKAMLRKLDDPVVVPSKILIEPLRKLATEKLNAADAEKRRVELELRHHLDSDAHSDLTELPTSESEDGNTSESSSSQSKEDGNTTESSPSQSKHDNTHPSSAPKTRTRGDVKNPNKSFSTTHDTISPASNTTSSPKRTPTGKTPANHRSTAGTDHDTASPASNTSGSPKRKRVVKTPCQIPTAGPCQIPTTGPRQIPTTTPPGTVFSDGPANAPLLENPPPRIPKRRISSLADPLILDLSFERCVSEPLVPSKPQDQPPMAPTAPPLSTSTTPPLIDILSSSSADPAPPTANLNMFESDDMRLLSTIDFSKPLSDETSSSSDIPLIFLDEPMDAYNYPIPVPVLPFTSSGSQQKKNEQPQLAEIINTPQAPCIEVAVNEPLSTPTHHFYQPDNKPITSDGFAPMDIDIITSPVEDTVEEPKPCTLFSCLDEDIEQAKLKLKLASSIPGKSRLNTPVLNQGSSTPYEQFVPINQSGDGKSYNIKKEATQALPAADSDESGDGKSCNIKKEATQALPAADSDASASPNEDIFQCLDKDIEESKLSLKSATPIPAKARLPHTSIAPLPHQPRIRDESLAAPKVTFVSSTFDFRVNTYTQAKCEQPSKPISPVWTLPINLSSGRKTEAIQALKAADCNIVALPSSQISPQHAKTEDNGCTHSTHLPSLPQPAAVLDIPAAANFNASSVASALPSGPPPPHHAKVDDDGRTFPNDPPSPTAADSNVPSIASALPSSPPSPHNVKVGSDGCYTHPTNPPSPLQPAVVLDVPIASEFDASTIAWALPSSPPPPQHVKIEDYGCASPTDRPSLPQLAVVLEIPTAADSNVPSIASVLPSDDVRYTDPTSPPSLPQPTVVLDVPTAADSDASTIAWALPSSPPPPHHVKIDDDRCASSTDRPSLPQPAVVLEIPTAADSDTPSIASALPSSPPSPHGDDVSYTDPTNPPTLAQPAAVLDVATAADSDASAIVSALSSSPPPQQHVKIDDDGCSSPTDQPAVVLEIPTAADSDASPIASALPSSPPPPEQLKIDHDGCASPTDRPSLPQPAVVLEIPTAADSNIPSIAPALPSSPPSPHNVKVGDDVSYTDPTNPPTLAQPAAVLDVPTSADSDASTTASALLSSPPPPHHVMINDDSCASPTDRPSLPQLEVVLEIPTSADSNVPSIASALPSSPPSPHNVKVGSDGCYTHPTNPPSPLQPAVVLDVTTAADSDASTTASALPSSPPPPHHVMINDDGCASPTDQPSLPQLEVVLEIPTSADIDPSASPTSLPHTDPAAAWDDDTSTTASEDTVRGGPADVPSADANETYHPLSSSPPTQPVQASASISLSLVNSLEEDL